MLKENKEITFTELKGSTLLMVSQLQHINMQPNYKNMPQGNSVLERKRNVIQNSQEGLRSRLKLAEEGINELNDNLIKTIHLKDTRGKKNGEE